MPDYRRVRDGSTFFFTVVARNRQPVLCHPAVKRQLRQSILDLRHQRPFQIDAWVLLPDHLHCIWTLPDADNDYSARWGWLKKEVTKQIRSLPELVEAAYPSLWQKRFWEHRFRDEADYAAHCDYIHLNPVKHGWVSRPADWPWSTFHRFVSEGIYTVAWGREDTVISDDVGNE